MNTKANKTKKQSSTKWTTIRVREHMKVSALAKLKEINSKDIGRNLKLDEVIAFAFERLTNDDIKSLQNRSLSNTDRQELLRKKYSDLHGPVTSEEFVGITMTLQYFEFLKEHGQNICLT